MAWREFHRGKGKKTDVQQFEYNLEDNLFHLHQELKNKRHCHSHYTSFYIQDPKLRYIHKACVRDRVLHHAVFRILYPIFDPTFIFDSYSCRIKKGTHRAVGRLQKFARKVSKNNTKNCYILKCDIKKFFDSVDHDILINLIQKKIKDENTVWLIKNIIKSFSISTNKGLPLGNITSQIFANIYLNELDQFIKHKLKIKYYIRYCDDFVILSNSDEYLRKLIFTINDFLRERLKLSFHSDKISIRKYRQGVDFLGYVSFPYHRVLRTKTKRRMFRKIRQKIIELKLNKIPKESFNQSVQSYLGILKHCNSYKLKMKLFNKLIYANRYPRSSEF
ncbi:MAG TPA: reverse transcriptase/maturase family protein [Candidatus Paceibacterota bacterium]|nr:reverse transcriptase/maturase family protein [Candidatus Paceibacterota bacterium]